MGLLGTVAFLAASMVATAPPPLEKVVDSNVVIPGATDGFTLGSEIPCSENIIFTVSTVVDNELVVGLYRVSSRGIEVIANWETPIPGKSGIFERAQRPTCAGDQIIFPGDDDVSPPDQRNNLYTYSLSDGNLALFLGTGTSIDGEEFLNFQRVDAGDSVVGIDARLNPASDGQVLAIKPFGGEPFIVADLTTVLPGQTEPVTIFSLPDMDGDDLIFRARTQQNLGIYRWSESEGISIVADTATPVPIAGQGNFGTFGEFTSLDDGIVFEAGYFGGVGLFIEVDGDLQPFLLPGSISTDGHVLGSLQFPKGAGSLLTFRANPPNDITRPAIFVRTADGEVHRMLGVRDIIDGLEVFHIRGRADAESVIIWIASADDPAVTALYRATFEQAVIEIPVLSGGGLLAFGALVTLVGAMMLRRRRHQHR